MPEFEARRTPVPPYSPPLRRGDETDGEIEAPGAPEREGLPPGFRMRHDAHYVDQLTARAAPQPHIRSLRLRDIDSPRAADPPDLDLLVRSIATHGVLQPLLVRARHGRFELIAGGGRLRAAALAGLSEVPCLVHACDDERARALGDAASLGRASAAPMRASGDLSATALGELRRSFGTIGSCLHLMVEREAPLRDRVALDLIRTETHRAHRLVQAIHLLTHEPALAPAAVSARALLGQVLDALEPERRLSAAHVSVAIADGAHDAWGDPDWMAAALSGAIGALLALVQHAKAPALDCRLETAAAAAVRFEIAQRVVTVPEWAVARFFDAAWTDRPGGYPCAVALAAARHACDRHGGSLELLAGERGGCRLVMTWPSAIER